MSVEKQTLVFVHGYLGGSAQWLEQVSHFSTHYHVLTPELPGFGLSAQFESPETITGYAKHVLNELDQEGIEQFHLVGHSMGGMISQEIMTLAPERINKLVLYGTGPIGIMPGRFETIEASRNRILNEGVITTARHIAAKWFVDGKEAQAYEACASIAEMPSAQAMLAGLTAMESWSGVDGLKAIQAPTLVLWGDRDRSYSWPAPERLWHEIPNAGLSVLSGCSHAVHLEKPTLFNMILEDFLAR